MSEAPIVPEPGPRPDIVKSIEYQRTPFPIDGRFVQAFLGGHPEIVKTQSLWPDLIEVNRGQPEVTMIFPGFNEKHTERIMKGRTVHSLIEKLNDTVGFIDWMNLTHIEELIACGLADHFEKNNYKGIKLFGTSHGGYFALRLVNYFHKFRQVGFNIPIESLVVAVAPASRGCFKSIPPDAKLITIGLGHLALDGVVRKISGRSLGVPGFVWRPRSDAVRLMAVSKTPFHPGDFPEGQIVHYFATDAELGNKDRLVNQPRAIKELQAAGVKVIVHDYKPDPKVLSLGHIIGNIPKMNEDLIQIFSQSDKIK